MISAKLGPAPPLSLKQRRQFDPFWLHFGSTVCVCVCLVKVWVLVWKLSMTLEVSGHVSLCLWPSTVPDSHWIHQPLFSLHGHLWCHCKHKLCPQMKDQQGFVPLGGQTNSKYGQATTGIVGMGGRYGGSGRTSFTKQKQKKGGRDGILLRRK